MRVNTRDTAIDITKNVPELVAVYQSAMEKIEAGYRMIGEAYWELDNAYGTDHKIYISMNTMHANAEDAIKDVAAAVKQKCWRSIIDRVGIKKVMSISQKEKLEKRLDSKDLPEITDNEVYQIISDMRDSASGMAKEAVIEVFEFLRRYGRYDKLKTNQKSRFAIDKKVILHNIIENWYGKLSLYYAWSVTDNIISLDRIFHLLDGGKQDTGYRSELVDAINTSEDGTGETQYFRFRACKNGNLHLEFKRPDLVQKLNAIAGNTTELKGK